MVALGLLTEDQAEFVIQRYLAHESRGSLLYLLSDDEYVPDLLGLTAGQRSELEKVGKEAKADFDSGDSAAMNVLTPSQRAAWSQLRAKWQWLATLPNLPAPSAAEAARIKLNDVSPMFRALAEKADEIRLSEKQKKLLDRLKEITCEGLFWIGRGKSKNAPEFVKQAEQVALFGILTEKQEALVNGGKKTSIDAQSNEASDSPSKNTEATPNGSATKEKPSEIDTTGKYETPPGFLMLPAYTAFVNRERRQCYGIDAAQEKELQSIADTFMAAQRKINDAGNEAQKLPPKEQKARFKELQAQYLKAEVDARSRIANVLTAQQKADYVRDQEFNQALGFCQDDVRSTSMISGIELSQQQREQFARLAKEDHEHYRGKSKQANDRLFAVITSEQREKLLAHAAEADTPLYVRVLLVDATPPHQLAQKLSPPPLNFEFYSRGFATLSAYGQLSDPELRRTLSITTDQEAKLNSLQAETEAAVQKIFDQYEPPTVPAKPWRAAQLKKQDEYRQTLEKFGKEVVAKIEAILQPQQIAALRERRIENAAAGMLSSHVRAAIEAIHVTPEQSAKLWEIYSDITKPDLDWERAEGAKALAILTPEQRKKLGYKWDVESPASSDKSKPPAKATDPAGKTPAAQANGKASPDQDWSDTLNDVRVRLIAPKGTTYRHGALLPLVVELQNYGDKPIACKTLWHTVRFLAHDSDGKWIGVAAMGPELGGWVGQADLAPGKTAELRLALQSLRFLRPLKPGETIKLQASAPTQTPRLGQLPLEVLTPPLSIHIQDAFPPDVGDADFPAEWKMNLACELNMGLLGSRRLQVDDRGAAKLVNAYVTTNGQHIENFRQVTLPPERLKQLAAALRKMQAWKLGQVPKDIPYPDEGAVRLVLVCPSGASVVGEYPSHIESNQPLVGELRKMIEGLMGDVEKAAKP
jgi:hypothetical protein